MSLLVVGSVAYDSIQTPHGGRDDILGGSATFFGIAAARLARADVVAVVGDDFRSEDMELLSSQGVGTDGIRREPGRTFRWRGRYHDDMKGRDTLATELNVFEHFDPELSETNRQAALVFLANIHPSLQARVLDQVSSPHFVAMDTMNFWIAGARDDLLAVLGRVDALFLNDEEALELTGERTIQGAARAIQNMGPSLVVVKRGDCGAWLVHGDDAFLVPAYPVTSVLDPTGAGDAFAGGFMGHLASTMDFSPSNIRRAAVLGSVIAAYSVEGFSVEGLLDVTPDQIEDRYMELRRLIAFESLGDLSSLP